MSVKEVAYVESLISYINDVKPYHSKLIETIVEYQHTDFMNARIDDNDLSSDDRKFKMKIKQSSNWCTDFLWNGSSEVQPYYRTVKLPMVLIPRYTYGVNNYRVPAQAIQAGGNGYSNRVRVLFAKPPIGEHPPVAFANISNVLVNGVLVNGVVTSVSVIDAGSGYTTAPEAYITATHGANALISTTLNATGGIQSVDVIAGGSGYASTIYLDIESSAKAAASISNGSLININLTSGGSNFTSIPKIRIEGGGVGATAEVKLNADGSVASFVRVISGGNGYLTAPQLTFISSDGNGSGAAAVATVSGGFVLSIEITNHGSGYTLPPILKIASGSGATAKAVMTPNGRSIAAINLLTPGSGYTSVPNVIIDGGALFEEIIAPDTSITGFTKIKAGSGYPQNPKIEVRTLASDVIDYSPRIINGGIGCSAQATVTNGAIDSIDVLDLKLFYRVRPNDGHDPLASNQIRLNGIPINKSAYRFHGSFAEVVEFDRNLITISPTDVLEFILPVRDKLEIFKFSSISNYNPTLRVPVIDEANGDYSSITSPSQRLSIIPRLPLVAPPNDPQYKLDGITEFVDENDQAQVVGWLCAPNRAPNISNVYAFIFNLHWLKGTIDPLNPSVVYAQNANVNDVFRLFARQSDYLDAQVGTSIVEDVRFLDLVKFADRFNVEIREPATAPYQHLYESLRNPFNQIPHIIDTAVLNVPAFIVIKQDLFDSIVPTVNDTPDNIPLDSGIHNVGYDPSESVYATMVNKAHLDLTTGKYVVDNKVYDSASGLFTTDLDVDFGYDMLPYDPKIDTTDQEKLFTIRLFEPAPATGNFDSLLGYNYNQDAHAVKTNTSISENFIMYSSGISPTGLDGMSTSTGFDAGGFDNISTINTIAVANLPSDKHLVIARPIVKLTLHHQLSYTLPEPNAPIVTGTLIPSNATIRAKVLQANVYEITSDIPVTFELQF